MPVTDASFLMASTRVTNETVCALGTDDLRVHVYALHCIVRVTLMLDAIIILAIITLCMH